MSKKVVQPVNIDWAFFTYLWQFYQENRGNIRRNYRDLTRRILDFNDPSNSTGFLRQPQFEALEMYVFLKEYLKNAQVHEIFRHWFRREGDFKTRGNIETSAGQLNLLESQARDQYEPIFERMRANSRFYSNYIFALTMGTGKTILMATCIFYEFILANKFPKDEKYCHNALVFAPDKTVLQSLREIQSFDMSRVIPPEYVNFLSTNIQYHFLDEAGTALSVLDRSRFNLIVSNTQKIILKRQKKQKSPAEQLFGSGRPTYDAGSVYDQNADLYGFEEPEDEEALTTNQRFEKLRRLEQLGIYVDEAHHAFGSALARDMGIQKSDTSLRLTIDELAASLERFDTKVVACYNYTGTPYVGQEILPEVVYAYSLRDAIDHAFLKRVYINTYSNIHSTEFIQDVVDDFINHDFYKQRHEDMLPKLAFFASTIEELENELKPAVEEALLKHDIPVSSILVNVGDEKLTKSEDIREFNRLDTPGSAKQFILLVNKGREGWNCRSLFGVALFRSPKSKIFVLQATMRCLRSIGTAQQTGQVYLSEENRQILDAELQQNFRISIDELTTRGGDKQIYQVKVLRPEEKIKLTRVRRQYELKEKDLEQQFSFELDKAPTDKYKITKTTEVALQSYKQDQAVTTDITNIREKREFSRITLVAEISRYLNISCLKIEEIIDASYEGTTKLLEAVNQYNELLYDWIIPRLFNEMFEIIKHEQNEEYEVELVKEPVGGFYQLSASPDLVVRDRDAESQYKSKSFHLDTYCFDSDPERSLFWDLLRDGKVSKIFFTGMLTHGQSDFYIQYIDPESHTLRSYYPDFVVQKEDGRYVIIEVKGDNKIDDPVVLAKQEFAEQMAVASGMIYKVIKGSDAAKSNYSTLLTDLPSPNQTRYI